MLELSLMSLEAGTPYEGGMFRMKLVLGRDFPAAPPQGKSYQPTLGAFSSAKEHLRVWYYFESVGVAGWDGN